MKIWYEFLGGNLFGGYDEGVDQRASIIRYAEMCEAAIQAEYPDATVEVSYQIGVEGAGGGVTVADDTEDIVDRMNTENAALFNVEGITDRVYGSGDWYVMESVVECESCAQIDEVA